MSQINVTKDVNNIKGLCVIDVNVHEDSRGYFMETYNYNELYFYPNGVSELSWGPTTMFADGIRLTIEWCREHMDWMRECTSGEYVRYYEEMYEGR